MKWFGSGLPLILFKARSQAKWRLSRLKLFLGNENRSKSYQSIDVHSRKFNLFPFSSDGPNNNKSSWNNNHTSCWGKDFSNWFLIGWPMREMKKKISKDLRNQLVEIISSNEFFLSTRKFLVEIWKSNGWIYFKGYESRTWTRTSDRKWKKFQIGSQKIYFWKACEKLFQELYTRFLISSHEMAVEVFEVLSLAMTSSPEVVRIKKFSLIF